MGRGRVASNKPMIFDGSDLKQLIMKEQALCGLLFFFFSVLDWFLLEFIWVLLDL